MIGRSNTATILALLIAMAGTPQAGAATLRDEPARTSTGMTAETAHASRPPADLRRSGAPRERSVYAARFLAASRDFASAEHAMPIALAALLALLALVHTRRRAERTGAVTAGRSGKLRTARRLG
jgi:hypothetical protein